MAGVLFAPAKDIQVLVELLKPDRFGELLKDRR